MARDLLLSCFAFLLCVACLEAIQKTPNVQVYSRYPMVKGKENILHCYVENFHPPKIHITLLKDGVPMKNVEQSDLSFKDDWTFERLVHAKVIPDGYSEYTCKVEHITLSTPKIVKWENFY